MSGSIDFTDVAALQDYIRKFQPTLLTKLYHGFPSSKLFSPREGVKGEMVLTEMTLGTVAQKWNKLFTPQSGTIKLLPRTLRVKPFKVDEQIYPQDFEANYMGEYRKQGFQPDDLPFQAFILMKYIEKLATEQEIAAYKGVELANPADGAPLTDIVDGLLEIVADEIALNNLTPITTSAHTTSNAVANAEAVHAGLAEEYQNSPTVMLCSMAFARKYCTNHKVDFGKYTSDKKQGALIQIPLDFGDCMLTPTYGMSGSSRLICTPADNIIYGYDAASDSSNIRVQHIHRSIDLMIDGKIGFNFGIVHDKILAVNNLS